MSLLYDFKSYYNNIECSDMIIKSNNNKIRAHSVILANASPLFKTWSVSQLKTSNVFIITDHTFDAIEYAIKWIYGYREEITITKLWIDVLAISHFLQLELFNCITNVYRSSLFYQFIVEDVPLIKTIQLAYLYNSAHILGFAIDRLHWNTEMDCDLSELSHAEYKMLYTGWIHHVNRDPSKFITLLIK